MPNPPKDKVVKEIKPRFTNPEPIDRNKLDLKTKGEVGHTPRKLEDLKNILDGEKKKKEKKKKAPANVYKNSKKVKHNNINLSNINNKK
jgi:hypothetical protein